jgi:AraC-like DNA-binding protein
MLELASGLARLPLNLLDRASELRLDRDELARLSGFTETELADPDARIPLGKLWQLWQLAIERTGDDHLPLRIIQSTPLRKYGLVGYVMSHSATLRAAFERLARYSRIVTEAVRVDWACDATTGRITVVPGVRAGPPRAADSRLAFVVTAARELGGPGITPIEAHLPYPRPADTSVLDATFGAPLHFDRAFAALTFRRVDLDRPVAGADTTLGGYLDEHAARILGTLGEPTSLRERVRKAIWSALRDGRRDLEAVAESLGMSPRTLQRRLRESNTSFGAMLEEVRRELALGLLNGRDLAVYEIAFLLGYSEPSTFHRAFRRWTGQSPREYRVTRAAADFHPNEHRRRERSDASTDPSD